MSNHTESYSSMCSTSPTTNDRAVHSYDNELPIDKQLITNHKYKQPSTNQHIILSSQQLDSVRPRSNSSPMKLHKISVQSYNHINGTQSSRTRTSSSAPTLSPTIERFRSVRTITHSKRFRYILISLLLLIGVIGCVLTILPNVVEFSFDWIQHIQPDYTTGMIFCILIIICCNPFILGYACVVLSCAYIYKWYSFPLIYCSSVLGGTIWFTISQYISARYHITPNTLLSPFKSIRIELLAVQRAVQLHSFHVSCLLQLTFLPFGTVTCTLGLWNISVVSYILATMISRLKIILYIIVAMSVDDLRMLFTSSHELQWIDYLRFGIGLMFSMVSLLIIALYAKQQLKLIEDDSDINTIDSIKQTILNNTESDNDSDNELQSLVIHSNNRSPSIQSTNNKDATDENNITDITTNTNNIVSRSPIIKSIPHQPLLLSQYRTNPNLSSSQSVEFTRTNNTRQNRVMTAYEYNNLHSNTTHLLRRINDVDTNPITLQ